MVHQFIIQLRIKTEVECSVIERFNKMIEKRDKYYEGIDFRECDIFFEY